MRSIAQTNGTHVPDTDLPIHSSSPRFDRLARRVRRAGLVWAQAEPGHLRWSLSEDYLTTLVAESPWMRRQVDATVQHWALGEDVSPMQAMAGCWILPAGTRSRGDGLARGLAIAVTGQAAGPSGSLRALCQGARMDHELVSERMRQEPVFSERELPRVASMVRLIRPASLRPTPNRGVEALLQAVETTHRCVRGHSERTAHLADRLAAASGFSGTEREHARVAGLLHDVGKLGVPGHVLHKPGPLTEDERAMVNMHPEIGQRILQGVGGLDHAVPAVLWHHERWDGQGYPHRLSGERIPRLARLMSIVDSFDAMRRDRPYRAALSAEDSLREIREGAGRQFDPRLAETFVRLVHREPALAA
jgi:HD-GYP domain-containing protein (c-di-GMP phosphodiesterase class II)